MSANGCSAGSPPGEWAQLAHLSQGKAKAIGQHLLRALRKAVLNVAAHQPAAERQDLQTIAATAPRHMACKQFCLRRIAGPGKLQEQLPTERWGGGIFSLFF